MAIDPSERGAVRRRPGEGPAPRSLLFLSARVFLVAAAVGALLGLWEGYRAHRWLMEMADNWDRQYDTLILEGGRLRATGHRLPHFVEGGELIFDLYDLKKPSDLPMEGKVVIFQTRQMMSRQDGLVQVMDYGMAQQQFGIPDIQINSESMRQAIDAWGTRILAGVLLSTMVFWAWGRVVVCMLTAVAAAVMLTVGIKGSRRFFGWLRETWRVTWALPPLLGVLQAVGAQIDVIVAVVALSAPVAGGAWLTRDGRQD